LRSRLSCALMAVVGGSNADARLETDMATKLATLYHSPVTGQICCAEHAPPRTSDAWTRDRWRSVTPRDRDAWPMAELGEMRCETCAVIEARMRARLAGRADPADGG